MLLDLAPFKNLYQLWPSSEAVTLTIPTDSGPAQVAVSDALRANPAEAEQAPSRGAYASASVLWRIPRAVLGDAPAPVAGSVVEEADGTRWTVLRVVFVRTVEDYRCFSVNLAVYHGLDDQVDIERPTLSADATGAPVLTYDQVPYPAVRCRVQPDGTTPGVALGTEADQPRYTVTVEVQLTLGPHDRVRWGSVLLDIEGYQDAERLDELPKLSCVRQP